MKIRDATPNDINRIIELGKGVEEFSVGDCSFWELPELEAIIESDNDLLTIADDNGIIGFSIYLYNVPTKKVTFENCYVNPNHRGKGIANQLIEYSERILKEKGAKYFCSFVEEGNNSSLRVFSKNGYEEGKKYHWMMKVVD